MHKALVIHRVNNAIEISRRFIVVEERMQQAALVPAAVADRPDHRQACRAVAVDFAIHAEGFRQRRDLHGRGNTAHAVSAGAQNVAGSGFIIYSSCNARTMAKDIARLAGYRIERVQLFDMFPHTAHYEVLTLLVREV